MKIKLLGNLYDFAYEDLRNEGNVGSSCGMKTSIKVDPYQSLSQQEDTLLHEIFHQLSFILKLELDEATVHRIGASMHAVIIDNPDIFTMRMPDA